MNWFKGDISEAVQLSKANNLIFVVAIFGTDETSKNLEILLTRENIKKELENSNNFVCVRIESGSETYTNFVQIYQLVPVPSIFFIGKNGTPIEVLTGVIKSDNEIAVKIQQILSNAGKNSTTTSSINFIQAEQSSSVSQRETNKAATSAQSEDLVCENDVCSRSPQKESSPKTENKTLKENTNKSKDLKTTPTNPASAPEIVNLSQANSIDHEDQLKLARKRIQDKQKEREADEARLEKELELERRKSGKEVQKLQMDQKDQELLQLKEERKRAKMEEQAARQRILLKIASDRAERAIRFNPIPNQTQPVQSNQPPTKLLAPGEETRIQFRTPDGQLYTNSFNINETFTVIQAYVQAEIIPNSGLRNFSLATTFPRKEFSDNDNNTTLLELGLFPSALIMIISNNKMNPASEAVARSGGFINLIKSLVWGIFTPILSGFSYIGTWFGGQTNNRNQSEGVRKRASDEEDENDHDTAKKRNLDRLLKSTVVNDGASTSTNDKFSNNGSGNSSGGVYLRPGGNVHRLKDSKKDDDDNATWNGNSTQQQ